MEITKDTKLKDIQKAYPTLLDELKKLEPRVSFFETVPGKLMLRKASVQDVADMAKVPVEELLQGLKETIAAIEGK